ncbi:MAG: xylulose kinase [Spirochaetaceae bacterium]|nr:MAG: xylulose kinase [Spirochaetaceae bacterium]
MGTYVLGIDAGTESFRAGVYDASGRCLGFGVSPNENIHRFPAWAEQSIDRWDRAMVEAIQKALAASGVKPTEIAGIGLDGTSCTVVFLDKNGRPLRDAIIWMDIRAAKEAEEIANGSEEALEYIGNAKLSAEWFPCKVLWTKRNEPQTYEKAATIFEQTDWMVYRLTGEITGNINTTTVRWFYNARKGGIPRDLYSRIGLDDVFDKLPSRILQLGEEAGRLTPEMAERTGLPAGIPVAGGGADAYIGVIGVNALTAGKLALITGSSQLHIGVSPVELHTRGLFGSFPDALIPGLHIVEAGQISTGSVLKWFLSNFLNSKIEKEAADSGGSVYDVLNREAAKLSPGSDGLVVLEHWQGNRTPWVDSASRGVIRGLTLSHGPVHIYRAIMESVAYGTEMIIRQMDAAKFLVDEIIACGGATQSELWMQIHADVTGKPILIPTEQQAVSLGSAICATVVAGMYPSIAEAAEKVVTIAKRIEPIAENTERYREYVNQYDATYHALKDHSRRLVATVSGA